MTGTQYRVLGDLVAGGRITMTGLRPSEFGYTLFPQGPGWYTVREPTFDVLWRNKWVHATGNQYRPDYRITDAGRAAYAQAQARRAAQAAAHG